MAHTVNAMSTLDIQKALKSHKCTKKYFKGVFAIDKIPKTVKSKPAMYVINTDTSNKPGQHWLAIYFPLARSAEFFDSYGRSPSKYTEILKFLKLNSKGMTYNTTQLQSSFTGVCGQYCCLFLLSRCKGKAMKNFVKSFSTPNRLENDIKVKHLFKKQFSTKHV